MNSSRTCPHIEISRRFCRLRTRGGMTMFEVIFSISIGSILFALIAVVLLQSMSAVRTTKLQTGEALMLRDLSNRFRDGVHQATSYSITERSALFERPNGEWLELEVEGDSIQVADHNNLVRGRMETYRFSKAKQFSLSIRSVNGTSFAELSMTGAKALEGDRYELTMLAAIDAAAKPRSRLDDGASSLRPGAAR